MNTWMDLSQTIAGAVLLATYDANAVNPDDMAQPYDEIIRMKRDSATDDEISDRVGFAVVHGCTVAAETMRGTTLDLARQLRTAAVRVEVGGQLENIAKKLRRGDPADSAQAMEALTRLQTEKRIFEKLSDTTAEAAVWQPMHYEPIDRFMGGVNPAGLIVVGGPPGTGKTTFMLRLASCAAKKKKNVAMFSLEMTTPQMLYRMLEVEPTLSTKDREYIYCTDGVFTVNEIYTHAAQLAANVPLHWIGIDFADQVIPDRKSRGAVEVIDDMYRMMAALAKRTRVPVVVLSQLNDKYIGGRPRVNHLRGSRLIEAFGAMVILIYNPMRVDVDQGQMREHNALPPVDGHGYLIFGKSRFGFKEGGPGALLVPFDGASGWGHKVVGQWQPVTSI